MPHGFAVMLLVARLMACVRVLVRWRVDGFVLRRARFFELRGTALDGVGGRSLVAELLARAPFATLAAIAAATRGGATAPPEPSLIPQVRVPLPDLSRFNQLLSGPDVESPVSVFCT